MGKKVSNSRRKFMRQVAAGGLLATLPAPAILAQGKTVFKVAHAEGIDAPITNSLDEWTKKINEITNGEVEAQHFPAGQLGGFGQLVQLVQQGAIQATVGGPSAWADFEPALNVVDLGFVFDNEEHVDRVYQGELGTQISEMSKKAAGVEFPAFGEVGFRHLFTRDAVTDVAGLAGQKLRVPQMKYWIDFWNTLGANATPLPYNEQYTALSTGVIDGNETDVHSILSFKWHEQASNFTQTGHWFLVKALAVNTAFLNDLSGDIANAIRDAAVVAMSEQRQTNRMQIADAIAQVEQQGVTVHAAPDDLQSWVDKIQPLNATYGELSAESAELMQKIEALKS